MSDSYKEILVKKKMSAGNKLLKGVMITLTVLLVVVGFVIWPLLIAGVVLGVVSFFVVPKLDVEYEYLYVNGELDIDAIYSKQKRKKIGSYDMVNLEVLAPEKSHELDSFRNKPGMKMKDFTSGDPQVKSYILVMNQEKGQEMIKVELDESILTDIRRIAPRKVYMY